MLMALQTEISLAHCNAELNAANVVSFNPWTKRNIRHQSGTIMVIIYLHAYTMATSQLFVQSTLITNPDERTPSIV